MCIRDSLRAVLQEDLHVAGVRGVAVEDQWGQGAAPGLLSDCLLYTSDAADERSSVDLGGRRIIKKKKKTQDHRSREANTTLDKQS